MIRLCKNSSASNTNGKGRPYFKHETIQLEMCITELQKNLTTY